MRFCFFFVLLVAGIFAATTWGIGTLAVTVLRDAPWILILIGVWMLVAPRRGRNHRRWHQAAPARPAAPTQPAAAAAPVAEPPPAPAKPKRELPIDLRVKVEQIKHKADVLQGYA